MNNNQAGHFHLALFRGLSSAGRAPALHAGGQRFEPAIPHCSQSAFTNGCARNIGSRYEIVGFVD